MHTMEYHLAIKVVKPMSFISYSLISFSILTLILGLCFVLFYQDFLCQSEDVSGLEKFSGENWNVDLLINSPDKKNQTPSLEGVNRGPGTLILSSLATLTASPPLS